MTQRSVKIGYFAATAVLTIIVLMYVANSFFNSEAFRARFTSLKYPPYLILPLSTANVLGLIAIWYRKATVLKNFAYAGFLFNFLLALGAELGATDMDVISPVLAVTALMLCYFAEGKRSKMAMAS